MELLIDPDGQCENSSSDRLLGMVWFLRGAHCFGHEHVAPYYKQTTYTVLIR